MNVVAATPHIESIQLGIGERTRIPCDCPLGHDHTYSEWIELVGGRHDSADGGLA
ncbi:hypothetical protein ACRAWC_01065 [Leifsonia sp. L25]|uniref:hypothetical protein n=1 Tax=Actinomycetes TaxID=1760 RepID=UPI003D69609C